MEFTSDIVEQFASPGKLVGHLSYVLLVASMMMRSMKWLRAIAVSAGVVSALYGYFFLRDFVTVFWEIIFVTVNLVQLLLLEFENRRAKFSDDERQFVATALEGVEKAHASRLLRIAKWTEYEAGTELAVEDEPVEFLHFVLEGAVRVDKAGEMVGVCGHDDFVGEIGFMFDRGASATAVVTNSARCFSFPAGALRSLLDRTPPLRYALEASFNRNLVDKLVKSNEGRGTDAVSDLAAG